MTKKQTKQPEKKEEKSDLPYVSLVPTHNTGIFINDRTGVLFSVEINPYSGQRYLKQLNYPEQIHLAG